MASIEAVGAREILDSRGNPTVEVEVALDDGTIARAAVPSAAPRTGAFEAVERRDGDEAATSARASPGAVDAVLDEIHPRLVGFDASEQRLVDAEMIELDGIGQQGRTSAPTPSSASRSPWPGPPPTPPGCRCSATSAAPTRTSCPVPMMNILNGGAHADSNVDIQEFMIAPIGAPHVQRGAALGRRGLPRAQVRAEGARAGHRSRRRGRLRPEPRVQPCRARPHPRGDRARPATPPGTDIALALDVAASRVPRRRRLRVRGRDEVVRGDDRLLRASCVDDYPLVSIEDPLDEEDWDGWKAHDRPARLARADRRRRPLRHQPRAARSAASSTGTANALLVKVNQIGSLTETLDAVDLAQRNGYRCMMSHRSGETEDTTIADLAVATNCGQIKTGAPARVRARREVQPAAAHRGGARRRRGVCRCGAFPRFARWSAGAAAADEVRVRRHDGAGEVATVGGTAGRGADAGRALADPLAAGPAVAPGAAGRAAGRRARATGVPARPASCRPARRAAAAAGRGAGRSLVRGASS